MAVPQVDSDDDMPEEVTLIEGRERAEQNRKTEKENAKRLATELKEKRKARSEKKNKKKEVAEAAVAVTEQNADEKVADEKSADENNPDEKKVIPAKREKARSRKRKDTETEDASKSGEELAGKIVGSVMLDERVVQLIRARETQVGKGVGTAQHKYIEELAPEPKAEKPAKQNPDGRKKSRTQIVSLKAKPNAAAVNSALEFRNSHFFGSQVKRSAAMLPTSSRPYLASV